MRTSAGGLAFITASLAIALTGCQQLSPARRDLCPTGLRAIPVAGQSGIEWGGKETPKVVASIVGVAVQCFPVDTPASEGSAAGRTPLGSYEIAATATVSYKVHDLKWLDGLPLRLFGRIIFEAVSANGVVLARGEGSVRIVPGGDTGTASVAMPGLPGSQIQRVTLVQARWKYGR